MRLQRSRSARTNAAEAGFTLIELSITSAILLLVVGTLLSQLTTAQRSERYAADRAAVLDETRASMARMTKDLRQAWSIDPDSTDTHLVVNTYVVGEQAIVTYDIDDSTLVRSVDGATPEVLQTNLAETSIFEYEPDVATAQVVTVLLRVRPPASPDTVVSVTSEVRLRNLDGG